MAIPGRTPSLGLLTLPRRRGWRILGLTTLTVGLAAAYNTWHGPRYTASMRVLVSPGVATLSLGADGGGGTLLMADHGQAARNLAALLSDPGLVAPMLPAAAANVDGQELLPRAIAAMGARAVSIAKKTGLIAIQTGEQRFQARLGRAFAASALGDTDVLKLDLTWETPGFAAGALGMIAAGAGRAVSGAEQARAELGRAQAALREAQGQADNAAEAPQAPAAIDAQKAALTARMTAASQTADQIRLALELARRNVAGTEAAYRGGGWVGGAEGGRPTRAFADLLEQKQALESAAAPDVGAIGAIDARIAQLREQNYRHARARGADEVAGAQAKLALVQAGIGDDQAALSGLEAQGARAVVQAQLREARQAGLAQARARVRLAEQRIDGAWQEVGAVRVLSPARPPAEPDWPAPDWLLRMGAALALAAGVLSAAMAERARRTIDYPSDITHRLGLEVLARLAEQPAVRAR